MSTTTTAARPRWVDDEGAALSAVARDFFRTEVVPHFERFDQQKHVDREVWLKAGALGLLCCEVPDEYGGGGGTFAHEAVVLSEQARAGDTGLGLQVHSGVVAPYLVAHGTEEQKARWLPGMASGDLIGAVAMSEPGAGTDLKNVRTSATRNGDHYLLNGSKTFISNGSRCDLVIVVAKTDPAAGRNGISLLVLETAAAPGFRRGRTLDKLGLHSQDTAELFFEDVPVPVENLLGAEGAGFGMLMRELPRERLVIAVSAVAAMERALEETIAYAKTREVFGAPLFAMQHVKFELAELATIVRASRVFLDDCVENFCAGTLDPATASMAKWWLTQNQCDVTDRCLQLFGGYGYMREYLISRLYVDARAQKIYGGTNEVMKDLISRAL
ncbi:acyl-CoA dehydrogenase [Nonomuraea sp. PA05]|uniref:acyl-CoA dehydrogenase family protein n=1 Tax=Nonomuraea sp. PA05 TaxID=2604466 RepID=UPI0011D9DEC2|nr:acyl-CoA dehydrogenase family protein [Nonomuraea sp. PA05]TYB57435.1 acyl-CoA dehydrogenase [Nonomuraea sp. PA05]